MKKSKSSKISIHYKPPSNRISVISQVQSVLNLPKLNLGDVFKEFNIRYSCKDQDQDKENSLPKVIKTKRVKISPVHFQRIYNYKSNENSPPKSLNAECRKKVPKQTLADYVKNRIQNQRKMFHLYHIIQQKLRAQKESKSCYRRRARQAMLSQLASKNLQKQASRRQGFDIRRKPQKYNTKFDFMYQIKK